jgi:hypothetical protein
MLKFKKYRYRVRSFAPSPVRVLDKFRHGARFFSPYGKNLSPYGNDIDAKHKQKSVILPVRELDKDRLFILWLEDLPHGRDFYPTGRKISHREGTCPGYVPG